MRNTRETPIEGGAMTAVQTDNNASGLRVAPYDCELIGVAMKLSVVADDDLTFDILVDGADSLVDLQLADTLIQGRFGLSAQLSLSEGQTFNMRSNGEQTAATTADLTWLIKPT